MKITEIKLNPNNPRVISAEKFEKLKSSIKDFPQMLELRPLVIDENNIVLGGNMRLRALQDLGIDEVPILYAKDLTEEQKKEFTIKDNLSYGEWDIDSLANQYDSDILKAWGLDSVDIGFFNDDVDSHYNDTNCLYPIVPEFDESYSIFVVMCKNEKEIAFIKTKLNCEKSQSYKNSATGDTYVVAAENVL